MASVYNGIGWMNTASPDQSQATTAGEIKNDAVLVAESIHRIINTRHGERPGNPDFGCKISLLLFENDETVLRRSADFFIREAVAAFEPRAKVISTATKIIDEHLIQVSVVFALTNLSQSSLFRTTTTITTL